MSLHGLMSVTIGVPLQPEDLAAMMTGAHAPR